MINMIDMIDMIEMNYRTPATYDVMIAMMSEVSFREYMVDADSPSTISYRILAMIYSTSVTEIQADVSQARQEIIDNHFAAFESSKSKEK